MAVIFLLLRTDRRKTELPIVPSKALHDANGDAPFARIAVAALGNIARDLARGSATSALTNPGRES
jgi:hypothetical protein